MTSEQHKVPPGYMFAHRMNNGRAVWEGSIVSRCVCANEKRPNPGNVCHYCWAYGRRTWTDPVPYWSPSDKRIYNCDPALYDHETGLPVDNGRKDIRLEESGTVAAAGRSAPNGALTVEGTPSGSGFVSPPPPQTRDRTDELIALYKTELDHCRKRLEQQAERELTLWRAVTGLMGAAESTTTCLTMISNKLRTLDAVEMDDFRYRVAGVNTAAIDLIEEARVLMGFGPCADDD